jgi:2-(1,2-epoxy-1,2-dihydrophenyl)acetyl-CoA isomerase
MTNSADGASQEREVGVLVGDERGVRRIVLNRPATANAVRPEDRDLIIDSLADADADPSVRVVLLSSQGRHFCAGADLTTLNRGKDAGPPSVGDGMRRIMTGAQRLISAVLDCGKPVIAMVQGPAAGLGAHLALAADLVIASEDASFIESFVKRGLVVDAGGAYLLPRRIGLQKAKELAFFGDKLPAAQALALGLVNEVAPADRLEAVALEWAGRLAEAPTTAISLTKRLFNASLDGDRAASFLAEGMAQELQSHAEDSTEGVRSFLERRAPRYRGR